MQGNIFKKSTSILIFLFFCCIKTFSQAHLGYTEEQVRAYAPNQTWVDGMSNTGERYISTDYSLGSFVYYFNKSTGLCDGCTQIPSSMINLNSQVQIYNQKYVVTSKTSWTAYLEGGSIMYIELKYSDELKLYYFSYKDSQ
jgi:hypothetical protein